jgi:acetyl esterase/lipase
MIDSGAKKYPIDPELQPSLDLLLALYPGGLNAPATIQERRKIFNEYLGGFPPTEGVTRTDVKVPSNFGGPDIPVRLYRPTNPNSDLFADCALVFIHGGGMALGTLDTDDANAAYLCLQLDCLVISIEYRLAPEHPFPAALDDCLDVTDWVFSHTKELEISPSKISLFGGSAGGGLAIALGLRMRDEKREPYSLICAPYPMIEDRNTSPASYEITDLGVWDRKANLESWGWYLGQEVSSSIEPAFKNVSAYAAPSRATDLTGLPPIFTDIGDLDLFRDDVVDFAQRLKEDGNKVEFHLVKGMFHAGELFNPEAQISKKMWDRRLDAIRKAFNRG